MAMRRFFNTQHKAMQILSVFKSGEKLSTGEIARRLRRRGFKASAHSLRMWIPLNLLYKHLVRKSRTGVRLYSLRDGGA